MPEIIENNELEIDIDVDSGIGVLDIDEFGRKI